MYICSPREGGKYNSTVQFTGHQPDGMGCRRKTLVRYVRINVDVICDHMLMCGTYLKAMIML